MYVVYIYFAVCNYAINYNYCIICNYAINVLSYHFCFVLRLVLSNPGTSDDQMSATYIELFL